jgi:hypothetical protein
MHPFSSKYWHPFATSMHNCKRSSITVSCKRNRNNIRDNCNLMVCITMWTVSWREYILVKRCRYLFYTVLGTFNLQNVCTIHPFATSMHNCKRSSITVSCKRNRNNIRDNCKGFQLFPFIRHNKNVDIKFSAREATVIVYYIYI